MAFISQAEYARRRNVSRPYISKLVSKGIITLVNGKIDPVKADKQVKDNSDPVRSERTDAGVEVRHSDVTTKARLTILKARAKRELYKAAREERDYKIELGKLIDADIARKEVENIFIAFKSRLLVLPTKVAPEIVGLKNTAEVKEVLQNAIYECLGELAAPEFIYKESTKSDGSTTEADS